MSPRRDRVVRALARNDRFATPRMLASVVAFLLVALSYGQAKIENDGLVYYNFMRRLVGEDVDGYAYQYASAFWNAPFYLVARTIGEARGDDFWLEHVPISGLAILTASVTAVLVSFWLAWRLVHELGLPGGPGAVLLAALGSPLGYYAIFEPSYKHAFDALVVTAFAYVLLRAIRAPSSRLWLALGVLLGIAMNVRYANGVLVVGPLFVLLRSGALRQAYAFLTATFVAASLILVVPAVAGIPYGLPPQSVAAAATVVAQATGGGVTDLNQFKVDPLAPLRMLFSLERGLFVWTPLTLIGVAGYVGLAVRAREARTFLVGLGLSALSLLLVHVVWGSYWTGGWAFSQRFLTALFPLFAIGVAEVLARTRLWAAPVLFLCVGWTLFLATHHYYGYFGIRTLDRADWVVELYVDGEENADTFWNDRIGGPVGRHWRALGRFLS